MKRHLFVHYSNVGNCRFLEHVSKTLIDKTDHSDPLKRIKLFEIDSLHYGTIWA